LLVAEQANEEKIIGKEHLPLDFGQAVQRKHAVVFAAIEQVRGAAIKRFILLRRSAHTNSRQKQWSDHNYFFPVL
jgi:hypothetical protein